MMNYLSLDSHVILTDSCCLYVYRCVHTDSCWGRDDARGLPRVLRCHSRISVPAGNSEYLLCKLIHLGSFKSEYMNNCPYFLSWVLLLLGDPLCLWSGCSNVGFHEQGHSKQHKHKPATEYLMFALISTSAAVNLSVVSETQISKELINFYDSAYIKAVDVTGSTSKDSAIKVLDVFHTTVRHDAQRCVYIQYAYEGHTSIVTSCDLLFLCVPFSSTAVVKATTPLSSNKSPAPCVPKRLQKIFWNPR